MLFSAIYPESAATLGFYRGEGVYARDCVHTVSIALHTKHKIGHILFNIGVIRLYGYYSTSTHGCVGLRR